MVFTKEGRLQMESKTCFDVSSYSYLDLEQNLAAQEPMNLFFLLE